MANNANETGENENGNGLGVYKTLNVSLAPPEPHISPFSAQTTTPPPPLPPATCQVKGERRQKGDRGFQIQLQLLLRLRQESVVLYIPMCV